MAEAAIEETVIVVMSVEEAQAVCDVLGNDEGNPLTYDVYVELFDLLTEQDEPSAFDTDVDAGDEDGVYIG